MANLVRKVITATGTTSWTCPANVHFAWITCVGAGGGGGGGGHGFNSASPGGAGGAGGAGGSSVVERQQVATAPGTTYDAFVGTGGSAGAGSVIGGSAATNGTAGTDSYFKVQGGATLVTSYGGARGNAGSDGGAALGGAGGGGGAIGKAGVGEFDTTFRSGNGGAGGNSGNNNGVAGGAGLGYFGGNGTSPELLKAIPESPKKIYIAVGNEGKVMVREAKTLANLIKKAGLDNVQLFYEYLPKEDHGTILHQATGNAFELMYAQPKNF